MDSIKNTIDKNNVTFTGGEGEFSLSYSSDGKEIKQKFKIPDSITLWQVKQLGLFTAKLTKECSRMASVLFSGIVTSVQATTETSLLPLINGLSSLSNESIGDSVTMGAGELIGFLCSDNNLERVIAILYLQAHECRLSKEQLEERVLLFEDVVELNFFLKGIKSFFMSKLSFLKNMPSLSKIFETQKNELVTPIQEPLTVTSQNSNVLLTPSQTDTLNESGK